MPFFIHNEKPFYIDEQGKIYPCAMSATATKVDFSKSYAKTSQFNITSIMTEEEVRRRLGLKLVVTWDSEQGKLVEVSNDVVSSFPQKRGKGKRS